MLKTFQESFKEFNENILKGINTYIKETVDEFKKDYPDRSIYETSIADFLVYLERKQKEHLEKL